MSFAGTVEPLLLSIMDKVTPGTVWTEANCVISPAQLCLVLGMTVQPSELCCSMCKLTLGAILAGAALVERATELRLVACGSSGSSSCQGRLLALLDHAHRAVSLERDVTQRV